MIQRDTANRAGSKCRVSEKTITRQPPPFLLTPAPMGGSVAWRGFGLSAFPTKQKEIRRQAGSSGAMGLFRGEELRAQEECKMESLSRWLRLPPV